VSVTTVKHLAQRVAADERTLRRAVDQGVVRCERVSPRRLRVASDEERYLRENWPLLESLRAALRTEPNVRFAALFGSRARGEQNSDSDLDVLVDLRDGSWERRHRLNTRLERALGNPVELVLLDRIRSSNPSLLAEALRDGRVLVDRADVWPGLKRSEPSVRRAAREQDVREHRAAQEAIAELGS
jgi:predicted nucleotidyltransferase